MVTEDKGHVPSSPWVAAINRAAEAGDAAALAVFRAQMDGRGGVLVEPSRRVGYSLVTFAHDAGREIWSAVLAGGLAGWDLEQNRMMRLPGTSYWYRTYEAPNQPGVTYKLLPGAEFDPPQVFEEELRDLQGVDTVTTYFFTVEQEDPHHRGLMWSVSRLTGAPPLSWIKPVPGMPVGHVEVHYLASSILRNRRHIWVYTPPGYDPEGAPCDLIVQLDGDSYTNQIGLHAILDNLVHGGYIVPTVAVLVDNIDHPTRMKEYGCNPRFVDFLAEELLPWVRRRYNVTSDPDEVIVSGSSMGGLAALFAGVRRPDVFGKVLSQSGSFWWKPEEELSHEWLTRQIESGPRVPLRVYLEVGCEETATSPDRGPTQIEVNRRMYETLRKGGYPVLYSEFEGGHDWACWKYTIEAGLLALSRRPGA